VIKAVCFDLDGVYFTPEGKKSFETSLIDLSNNKEKALHVLYQSTEMLDYIKGIITEEVFWDYVREYLSINLTNEELTHLWVKDYQINIEVKTYIEKIKRKGYISCTCSNNNPARVRGLQNMFHFLEDFDVSIFSYETGTVKPSIEIFKTLVEKAGVKPSELVYSDDNPERLHGAKELGITAFIYKDFTQFTAELEKLGVR